MLAPWTLVPFAMPFTGYRYLRSMLRQKWERPLCWLFCVCHSSTQLPSLQINCKEILNSALPCFVPYAAWSWASLSSGFPLGLVGDPKERRETLEHFLPCSCPASAPNSWSICDHNSFQVALLSIIPLLSRLCRYSLYVLDSSCLKQVTAFCSRSWELPYHLPVSFGCQ